MTDQTPMTTRETTAAEEAKKLHDLALRLGDKDVASDPGRDSAIAWNGFRYVEYQAAEIARLKYLMGIGGVAELSIYNVNVKSYMEHWEGRAEAAESRIDALTKERDEIAADRDKSDAAFRALIEARDHALACQRRYRDENEQWERSFNYENGRAHDAEVERDEARAQVTDLMAAFDVGAWTEEERDGMAAAFKRAETKHGFYETLFAVGAFILRHRKDKALSALTKTSTGERG
jgi:hypothetical protein